MPRGQFGRPMRMRDFKKTVDIAKGVPPAWGLRRRFPGASVLSDPSDITRNFGNGDPSDSSRQAFIPNERMLSERYAMLRRRRKSGDRFKAAGY